MAGIEIANAYITLQTKMPGVRSDIKRALGGSDVQAAVAKSGSSMGSKLLGGLTKTLKVGALAAGGVLVAGLGTALAKGVQRLDAIEVARAKLTGLGNDASAVEEIMNNALASVKGTAFGLGDAATVAAQAVAAGAKPGKALEGTLKNVANLAAAAGTDLGEMGSLYAKAMTQANGIQNDVLGQLSDRGIPIYQALADQLGVTAGAVFDMAKGGEISFDQFAQAAETAAGTVAKEMGGTARGSLDNFMASMGRIGAGLLGGAWTSLAPTIQGITKAFGPLEEVAGQLGEKFGNWLAPILEKFVNFLNSGFDFSGFAQITSVLSPLGLVFKSLQPVLPIVGEALSDIARTIGGTLAKVIPPLMPVLGSLLAAFGELVKAILPPLVPIIQTIGDLFTKLMQPLMPLINALVGALAPVLQALSPIISLIAAVLKPVVEILSAVLVPVVEFLTQVLTALVDVISNQVIAANEKLGTVFSDLGAVATWLWEKAIKPMVDAIGAAFGWLWSSIIKPVIDFIVAYFRIWGAIVSWLWKNVVQPTFKRIGDVFSWVWSTIIKPVVDAIKARLEILGAAFSWLYKNAIKPAWDNVTSVLRTGWAWIRDYVFAPFREGIRLIKRGFDVAVDGIKTAWNKIKKAAAEPINFVLETVWNNGLRSFWNGVVGTLGLKDMKLPKADKIAFASGGVLPGYTPGRDVHEFYSPTGGRLALSGGEAIMRPEFTRAVGGPAGVDRLNAMARRGEAFAGGGVWNWLGDAGKNVANFAGDVMDNVKNAASVAWEFMSDPVGSVKKHLIDGLIKPLLNGADQSLWLKTAGQLPLTVAKGLGEKLKGAFSFGGEGVGRPGVGKPGMGWESMWGIVKNAIPGAVLTSAFRPGSVTVNGGRSYHGLGRAIDVIPATMDTFNRMLAMFPNARELIFSPAGGRQLLNGKPHMWGGAVRAQHWNHVHLAMANGGVVPKLYDQGGWLPNGGLAVNKTGKPEAVLTPDESRALKKGFGGALINGNVTFQSSGDFGSDLDKLGWELRKLARGSRNG